MLCRPVLKPRQQLDIFIEPHNVCKYSHEVVFLSFTLFMVFACTQQTTKKKDMFDHVWCSENYSSHWLYCSLNLLSIISEMLNETTRKQLKCRIFCYSFTDCELEELEAPQRYRPDSLASICKTTKFSEPEIKRMYRGFKAHCPNGMVKEDTFKVIYAQFFPQGGKLSAFMKVSLNVEMGISTHKSAEIAYDAKANDRWIVYFGYLYFTNNLQLCHPVFISRFFSSLLFHLYTPHTYRKFTYIFGKTETSEPKAINESRTEHWTLFRYRLLNFYSPHMFSSYLKSSKTFSPLTISRNNLCSTQLVLFHIESVVSRMMSG